MSSNAIGAKINITNETTGSLPIARVSGYPPATTGNYFQAADQAARLALGAVVGDVCLQLDSGDLYICTALPSNDNANWGIWGGVVAPRAASDITNTPAGGISATDVQAAINELDSEKSTKVGIQNQSYVMAADTGAADAYAIAPSPAIAAYVTGQRFSFKAVNANTGASTLAVSALAAKAIKKNVSDALVLGDIPANLWIEVVYDGTNFQLVSTRNALTGFPYVKVSDTVASGTNGGTFTLGAWRTRDIQTEDSDASGICTIAANQITLAAGTYLCRIYAPAFAVTYHKARLYNTTGAAVVLLGTSEYSGTASAMTRSLIVGRFTIAGAQALEIQHYSNATKATDGFGTPTSIATISEVYTVAEFEKVG